MASPRPLAHLPRCDLGEGPLWDIETGRLYWVDISGQRIHRWAPGGACETHETDTTVGFVVLDEPGRLVAGLRDGVYELEFGTPHRRLLARPDMHPENRFNDGACDPRGRLWAGTMHVEASRDRKPTGALYRHVAAGLEMVERDIGISNGIGWSPSGTTMYYAETHRGIVWAYDYDLGTGRAYNRRVFAEVPIDIGVPDGLAVDTAGRVYVAIWRGARLNVYASDGTLDAMIAMPVPHATSCCFGGADLLTLYITTMARGLTPQDLASHPFSGCLFELAVDIPGVSCARMRSLAPRA